MKWLVLAVAVTLSPYAVFTGRTVNTSGEIVYWDVWYEGYDSVGNLHRIKEVVILREPPYDQNAAKIVAMQQIVEKLEAGDEQVMGFLKALEGGQEYESNNSRLKVLD